MCLPLKYLYLKWRDWKLFALTVIAYAVKVLFVVNHVSELSRFFKIFILFLPVIYNEPLTLFVEIKSRNVKKSSSQCQPHKKPIWQYIWLLQDRYISSNTVNPNNWFMWTNLFSECTTRVNALVNTFTANYSQFAVCHLDWSISYKLGKMGNNDFEFYEV